MLDDLVLIGESAEALRNSVNELNGAYEEFEMTISSSKTQVMHIRKERKSFVCKLKDDVLEQMNEFKYLRCVFSKDGRFNRELEQRRDWTQCDNAASGASPLNGEQIIGEIFTAPLAEIHFFIIKWDVAI